MPAQEDATQQAMSSMQDVFSNLWKAAVGSVDVNGLKQSDLDKAVADAQGLDKQAMDQAKAASDAAMVDLKSQIDALSKADADDKQAKKDADAAYAKLVSAIAALVQPAPSAPADQGQAPAQP